MATASWRCVRPPSVAVSRAATTAWRLHAAAGESSSSAGPTPPLRLHPAKKLPPRVEHVIVETGGALRTLLPKAISGEPSVDETTVKQLVAIGAVYYATKPPPRDLTGVKRALRPKRVTECDLFCAQGSYLRVHVHPKRGPGVGDVDWVKCVIHQGDDYVVVDKPPGVSVNMTVDNAVECLSHQIANALIGDENKKILNDSDEDSEIYPSWTSLEPLKVVHRLDVCTSGVMMFAKSETKFARHFHNALRSRRVQKAYKCVTERKPKLGIMEHWTEENVQSSPRRHDMYPLDADVDKPWSEGNIDALDGSDANGRKRCVLRVTHVEEIIVGDDITLRDDVKSIIPTGQTLYEATVELVTGRTHQIRAQFAAHGAPLLGDVLYGGRSLCFGEAYDSNIPPRVLDSSDKLCLQSAAMTVLVAGEGESKSHETDGQTWHAGPPWWRRTRVRV